MKISSWGQSAPLSTGARSGAECATVRGRDCKLSDRDINLVIDSSRERYCTDLAPCLEVSLGVRVIGLLFFACHTQHAHSTHTAHTQHAHSTH